MNIKMVLILLWYGIDVNVNINIEQDSECVDFHLNLYREVLILVLIQERDECMV